MAPLIRPAAAGSSRTWRDIDLRWLAVCLVGAVVSAVAAWSVLVGRVPLDVVPPETVFAVACVILVAEWFLAAVMVAIYPDREADPDQPAASDSTREAPAPAATPEPPAPAATPEPPAPRQLPVPVPAPKALPVPAPKALPAPAPKALPALASPSAPAAEVAELQDRIEQLTAALTLTAAAENLQQVGTIAQQALAADIQLTRTS